MPLITIADIPPAYTDLTVTTRVTPVLVSASAAIISARAIGPITTASIMGTTGPMDIIATVGHAATAREQADIIAIVIEIGRVAAIAMVTEIETAAAIAMIGA